MNSYDVLKFMTVLMEGDYGDNRITATGFYVTLNVNGEVTPVIVTAKHFAEKTTNVTFAVRYETGNNKVATVSVNISVEWIMSANLDIACCMLKPIQDKLKKITGETMFYTSISEENILTEEEMRSIKVLSEVIAFGYPKGIGSTHNEFPLFKKGYLASDPCDDYENGMSYIDLTCIAGLSGSPIILNNSSLKLLGVLVKSVIESGDIASSMSVYASAYNIISDLKKQIEKNSKEE